MGAEHRNTADSALVGARILTGRIGAGERMDKAISIASGLSRERIKALMADGAVTVDGEPVSSPSTKAQADADFAIAMPEPAAAAAAPQDIALNVVYEDDQLIVIDKSAGLVVHPAAGNPDGTLVNALLHHCAGQLSGIGGVARPGIVHRIDKDTSGLMVAAKTDAAHLALSAQFAEHSIQRAYRAVVKGHPVPPAGTIAGRIGRSSRDRKKMAVLDDASPRGKHAVTHYRTLRKLAGATLVECTLETGRTHQIRVHMSSIGNALLGDPVYGRPDSRFRPLLKRLHFQRQALHAAVLGFCHPTRGDDLRFESDIPFDMAELIEELARSY